MTVAEALAALPDDPVTTRLATILRDHGFLDCDIDDLREYSDEELLRWKNFGQATLEWWKFMLKSAGVRQPGKTHLSILDCWL